jgi:hypothetical protein
MPPIAPLPPGQFISPLPIAPPTPGANNVVPFNRPPGDEPSLSTVKPSDVAQFPNELSVPKHSTPRKLPKVAYAYKPMAIAADAGATKKYTVQASKEAILFFTTAALNLTDGGSDDPLPRGAKPAKVHATVADGSPKVLKAEGSKRPYIRYGKGTRGGGSQYTFTAPMSIKVATAIDAELKTVFDGVKSKLGGPYGRVWFTPEYFVISDGGE